MMNTKPILVDEATAAAMLDLKPRTLQEWRRRGEGVPFVKISSRCIKYRVVDLEAFAEDRLRSSTRE